MYRDIDRFGAVKGVTVYACKNGVPEQYPCVIDAEITLPQITHPSATMQSMGDMEIPDQTRVNSMTTTINCEPSIIQSKLLGKGIQDYVLRWGQEVRVAPSGNDAGGFRLASFIAYISGIPAEDVGASLRIGESTTGSLTINTFKYRLLCDNVEIRNIDKIAGVLKINGQDFRSDLNKIL